ncbi:MAG: prephenate dehydratase domain-containing protein [candidate division KSB1 bacterium]|jgi:prephenate dehydratase/chorismate mutase/prephenate dehydratase|nr:prephenate dehydratase domain-containing protein [candidate division KSB1 bacterium]
MNLDDIRKKIDQIDSQILKLLDSRMELGLKAKKMKKEIEDLKREAVVLEKVRSKARGMLTPDFTEKLYKEVISESKRLQKMDQKLIGFQGEHGAYSEVASRVWDDSLIPIPCNEFNEVFKGVNSGLFEFGIVPVENTLGGVVSQVNQLILNSELVVVGAVQLNIHHCLMAQPGADHRELRVVYSHSQALEQCHHFLARNKLEPVPFYDTAGAAKMLAEKSPKAAAAIASVLAAELYDLEIIKENIEDFDTNKTRFFIFAKSDVLNNGNKCSVLFSTEHKAGTLFRVLQIFAKAKINLTRIESIPNRQGSYAFFLDFIGSKKDENIDIALKEAEKITANFRLLGCYREKEGG